jgi:hypothetical protein
MNITTFMDPVKIGPGVWFKMHIDALVAITDDAKRSFAISINTLCDNFKCKKCQPHFREFINSHPFEGYWAIYDNNRRDIGFFRWTWEFHNNVNKRLNKYQPSFEEAYKYYSNSDVGICFNCPNSIGSIPQTETPLTPLQTKIIQNAIDLNQSSPDKSLYHSILQRDSNIPIITEYKPKTSFKLISSSNS